MASLDEAHIDGLSREIALAVDRNGAIVARDGRAERVLGSAKSLRDLATPGTEAKIERLVERACSEPIRRFEVSLVVNDRPATFSFGGAPSGNGALLVGLLVDEEDASAFARVGETLVEIEELHRRADRDRKDLVDSNRALSAMHAEIDDKNAELRRASDVKTRVVSNVSHEFRTPINSILGITQLLLDRLDGDLTAEQEKQLRFVRTSAESLSGLVNDLLDLSRIEAGRHDLRVDRSSVTDLFSSLRGMMKPLARSSDVELVFEDLPELPLLETDVGKVGQILRNLVSNALKFTEKGTVTVRASSPKVGVVRFDVQDTGVGIAPGDRDRVFEEFTQIDGPLQRKVLGTGLGLSLSRKLAELLGGQLTVESELGTGSTFSLEIPAKHVEIEMVDAIVERSRNLDGSKVQVLVVEDNRQTLFLYERYLRNAGFQVVPARTVEEARRALDRFTPAAVVLDVVLEGESTWKFLRELKESPKTRDVPVMVVTVIDRAQKARALGADEFWLKPIDGARLIRKLERLARRGRAPRVLVIDDDPAARYLVRKLLEDSPYSVLEAETAADGVEVARKHQPDVILLDFVLGSETAFDVIDDLKAGADTRGIPIILQTAKTLDDVERERITRETSAIIKKESLSREVAIARIREALEGAGLRQGQARIA